MLRGHHGLVLAMLNGQLLAVALHLRLVCEVPVHLHRCLPNVRLRLVRCTLLIENLVLGLLQQVLVLASHVLVIQHSDGLLRRLIHRLVLVQQ